MTYLKAFVITAMVFSCGVVAARFNLALGMAMLLGLVIAIAPDKPPQR